MPCRRSRQVLAILISPVLQHSITFFAGPGVALAVAVAEVLVCRIEPGVMQWGAGHEATAVVRSDAWRLYSLRLALRCTA